MKVEPERLSIKIDIVGEIIREMKLSHARNSAPYYLIKK
jgi:hypothetical protein